MAFIGQYDMQTRHSLHLSVMTALPLATMASCLQKATHWLQPTQLLLTYIIFHPQNCPRPFSKSMTARVEINIEKIENLIWCLIFFYFI